MTVRKLCTAIALAIAGGAAQAATVTLFNDNFDADKTGDNVTQFLQGWKVTNGTVDVDGTGFVHNELPGHGHYVDLDGSTMKAGILSNSIWMNAGQTYTMSFALAGNQRNWGNDTVDVSFGDTHQTYVLKATAPLLSYSLNFDPTTSGRYQFSFHNRGGDNRGAFLDQVTITSSVPETSTYVMFLAGLLTVAGLAAAKSRHAASRLG